jgi:hypothetical protein
MAISRPDDLNDLANLGLTLVEAKQLLAHVRRDVVAAQDGLGRSFGKQRPAVVGQQASAGRRK